jgi:hypothetical protein
VNDVGTAPYCGATCEVGAYHCCGTVDGGTVDGGTVDCGTYPGCGTGVVSGRG